MEPRARRSTNNCMLTFAGNHPVSLDDKDRVVLPLGLRKCIGESDRESLLKDIFMVRPSDSNECLELYPKVEYDKYVEDLESSYAPSDKEGQDYLRFFTSLVEAIELDRQYRFTIPEASKGAAALGKKLIFVGRTRMIEIWDEATWAVWKREKGKAREKPEPTDSPRRQAAG